MKWTTKTFAGGQLSTVMAQTMLSGKARDKFLVTSGVGDEDFFGHVFPEFHYTQELYFGTPKKQRPPGG